MIKIDSPITILEFGSTGARLVIFNKLKLNQNLSYEKKIDFSKKENLEENHPVFDLIIKAENEIDKHLNEILLVLDSPSINSLDISIKRNFEKKNITKKDLDYLINECQHLVNKFNIEKEVIHILTSKIKFDDETVEFLENVSRQVNQVIIELKFILIDKHHINYIKKLLLNKHISLKNIYCASYIKCLGLINKLKISQYNSFIDIGYKKSTLLIFENSKLLYLNNIHIGGDLITKDISKILNIDYINAEAKKIKFSEVNKYENNTDDEKLLKNIINSRLEEIIELLFNNCPLIKNKFFDNNLNLYFTGQGSKVLNENDLSFGSEFTFIKEMSIIEENYKDCCESALKFNIDLEKIESKKPEISLENKGFFEKLFEYFSN